jgi:hypothetical protein
MLYSKIEGEGQPLLILHGFLGMLDNWKTLSAICDRVFKFICWICVITEGVFSQKNLVTK